MLSEKQIKGLVDYWYKGSKEDLKTSDTLYKGKRYSGCLFWCHLLLEKILKALVVKHTNDHAPKIHNLRKLAELANLELSEDEIKLLTKVNEFNMEGRYPNEKMEFYKLCTKTYTDTFYKPIILLYKKLCQKMK